MSEKINYISDDELERLIFQVEQEELVAAPPDLMESILEAVEFAGEPAEVTAVSVIARKKDFYAYCFRVITSVAAAIALVFLLPELTKGMNLNGVASQKHPKKHEVVQTVPSYEEVIAPVPSKDEVVAVKVVPSKEEVLDDTGFIEKAISNTVDWLNKESNEQ
jgi:hypothetical protein